MLALRRNNLPSLQRLLRCLSSSATPNPDPHFMVGYLITSCGLTKEKAVNAAKRVTNVKSPERPDSVIAFLKHWGFDDTQIRRLVTRESVLLGCSVEKRLEPNIRSLLDLGFSRPDLPRVAIRNPPLLCHGDIMPRIQFWRTLLGNDDSKLRTALERNRGLFCHDAVNSIPPKLALLKNHGLSDHQIQKLLLRGSPVFTSSANSIESLLKWTVDLGLIVDSPLYVYCLIVLSNNGRAQFHSKMELCKSYGWSEQEFLSHPSFISLSLKNIGDKMQFFMERAGCLPSYIARHPRILRCSLEKRLMPRNHVLRILKAKEVANMDLLHITEFTDEMFLDRCIKRFEDKVSGLLEIYNDACAGRFTISPIDTIPKLE